MSAQTDADCSFDEWWRPTHPKDSTVRPHVPRTVRDGKNSQYRVSGTALSSKCVHRLRPKVL